MNVFSRGIARVAHIVVRHPLATLVIALLLGSLGAWRASNLRIDTDLAKLLPDDYPSVQAVERLRETVGGESEVAIAIASPDATANLAYAEALIPALLTATQADGQPLFTRVEYRKDTQFIEENALYFATNEELERLTDGIEREIEDAKLAANPFFFDLGLEDEDPEDTSGSLDADLASFYEQVAVKPLPANGDSTIIVVQAFPAGSQTNLRYIRSVYANLATITQTLAPERFHPAMEITLAGRLERQLIEIEAITGDVARSFGAGVSAVLLLISLYFAFKAYQTQAGGRWNARLFAAIAWRTPFLSIIIAIPLVISLAITFGLAEGMVGTLNLMTSTLGLVLFGLGIDFGIHYYARYTEERGSGRSVEEATAETLVSTGSAITVGALTTAGGLFVLTVADFKGFSEFGWIAGLGILMALASMLLVLPALLTLLERTPLLNLATSAGSSPSVSRRQNRAKEPAVRLPLLLSIGAVIASIVFLPRLSFEYDFGALEPVYEDYLSRNRVIREVFPSPSRRNPAYVVVREEEHVSELLDSLRVRMDRDSTILAVEALQERFPTAEGAIEKRLSDIAVIRGLLDDPFVIAEEADRPELAQLRRAASTTAAIPLDTIPSYLTKRFTDKSGSLGTFIMIYPAVGLSDGRNSIAFSEAIGAITLSDGAVYHAGSTSLVAADMLRLMQEESPWMVLATFIIVALLMWVNFRRVSDTLLAILPLVVGLLWTMLLMEIWDIQLNFYNLVVLPALLGIGNDAGVHLVHRIRELGPARIGDVLRSTGEHVSMASITTMLGFAGPLLSTHPGLRSIGELAVIGIAATLLSALIFLPALVRYREGVR